MNLLTRLVDWLKHAFGRCAQRGCWRAGQDCYLPESSPGDPDCYYCHDHAHDAGFCRGCGNYCAGITSFDFSTTGLCEHCDEEFRHDLGECDEEDSDERTYSPEDDDCP